MAPSKSADAQLELWRLYDSENKIFFNNLNVVQLNKIIESIPQGHEKYWHICKDDETDWYPLAEKLNEITKGSRIYITVDDDDEELDPGHTRPTGVVSLGSFVEDISETRPGIKAQLGGGIEKRKINRFEKSIEVFIDVGEEILSATTKDISLFSIKLKQKFPLKYKGKYYPITLKVKPALVLRCCPLITEKEHIRGTWNIVTIDPNFNLSGLAKILGEEKATKK